MAGKFSACASTPEMQKCKISFLDVEGYATKAITLVQATGTQFTSLIKDTFLVYSGITGQDFPAVFAALNDANANAATIVSAIQSTFGV